MWRSFDVGAVVDALITGDGQVSAGAAGLDRTVVRARMIESSTDLDALGDGELVIATTRALLDARDGPGPLVDRLADVGAAAVAVHLDPVIVLSPELIAAADRRALPIITFPATATSAEVTTAVFDALLGAQGQRLGRFLDIHQRFAEVVLAAGDAEAVAQTLHALLACPVAILDPEGRPTLVVPAAAAPELDLRAGAGVRVPILAGEARYGEVVALNDGRSLDQDGQLALERAATALAVRLAQANAVAADQERFAATSLEELIAGHTGSALEAIERASSFGWDLTRPRAVLLASVDPPVDPATLPGALATLAAAARATLGPDVIVWTRSTSVAALLPAARVDARRSSAEALRRGLDERLRTVTVSIGVGTVVVDPVELPRSYREASRAVDVGRWAKGRHAIELFDELGLERLLASTPVPDLNEFVEQAIGLLVDHDRLHQSDLVETLEVWLETRNMAEAARRVHVHYNTLKNRLDRIEAILGPVLSDPVRCLECEVAVYIARHHDGPWAPAAGGQSSGDAVAGRRSTKASGLGASGP